MRGVIFMVIFLATSKATRNPTAQEPDQVHSSEVSSFGRQKRGFLRTLGTLFQQGRWAAKSLLKDAKRVETTDTSALYRKTGDYQTAVSDFVSVNPQNIKTTQQQFMVSREGWVGDRMIKIRKKGYMNQPTLYIIKPPKSMGGLARVDMVVYKPKPKPRSEPLIDMEKMLGLHDK